MDFGACHTRSKSITGERKANVKKNLMDLNEILSLDVMAMAMETTAQNALKKKRQQVLPEDDDNDPMIYVEETITVEGSAP